LTAEITTRGEEHRDKAIVLSSTSGEKKVQGKKKVWGDMEQDALGSLGVKDKPGSGGLEWRQSLRVWE